MPFGNVYSNPFQQLLAQLMGVPQQGGYNVPYPFGYSGTYDTPLTWWGRRLAGGGQGGPQQGGYQVPYQGTPLTYWGQRRNTGFGGAQRAGAPQQGGYRVQGQTTPLSRGRGYAPQRTKQPKYWGPGFSGR